MKVTMYDITGAKKGDAELPKALFGAEIKEGLIHLALERQIANARIDTAKTKTRTEIRGGGRKPWRQKGTGRARTGSIRGAQWRGGGVIFGPRGNRNFTKQMPKKMRRAALISALSAQAKDGLISVLDKYEVKTPKTKEVAAFLTKLGDARKVLMVAAERNTNLEKATNNLPHVKTILAGNLNIADLLQADQIIFLKDGVTKAEATFAPKA